VASRGRDWLELMRISNAPTIISNVLVGGAIAAAGRPMPWVQLIPVAAAMLLLYAAGMMLNDVFDAAVDRLERPGRPIPSGRISRSAAAGAASAMMILAIGLVFVTTRTALIATLILILLILAYNALHRILSGTVLIMGACRALVYVISARGMVMPPHAAATSWGEPIVLCASLIACYVMIVSVLARSEAMVPGRVRLVVAMICAISLLDAGLLVILNQPLAAGIAVACFIACAFLQRRILGT
jgi:4-hydroxybenzoate polyprenyltransferase